MIEKKLPSKVARVQLEIYNDGLYVAVYDDEDHHGVRNLFKVAVEDLVKDHLIDSILNTNEFKSDLVFELDCLVNYASTFKKQNTVEFKDSGFTDDFGVTLE
tara:strand:- start:1201 stop:1506 length:306 start_codon:yes stop_codon:yes gene_type:complete